VVGEMRERVLLVGRDMSENQSLDLEDISVGDGVSNRAVFSRKLRDSLRAVLGRLQPALGIAAERLD
jgi:hypothetical protein